MLAVAIGLNTAVFSVVSAVLLPPLAFAQPSRMVWLATLEERGHDELVTAHDVVAWRDATSLERVVAYDVFDGRVVVDEAPASARIATVSSDFWAAAGAQPTLGRLPVDGESEALLSWTAFEQRFGAKMDIIGKPIVVSGRPATIAGVLPAGFHVDLPQPATRAGTPPREIEVYHAITVRAQADGAIQLFRAIGQLRPGVSVDSARSELEAIRARLAQANPKMPFRPTLAIAPLEERMLGSARADLQVLLASVALVLLIACANIASLLVTRATVRQKEVAIRTAIGAGRGGILRPVFLEGLLLALLGGGAGVLVASACLQVVTRLIPGALPRLTQASLDGRVLTFAVTLSVATALLFSLGPTIALWRANAYEVLKDGTRTHAGARQGIRMRRWLVVGEIAITVVLLCGAGLLLRSLMVLRLYPAGFSPSQTVTVTVPYNAGGLPGPERPRAYIADVLHRLEGLPQMQVVGMTTNSSGRLPMIVEGAPAQSAGNRRSALLSSVSEGYAPAIGMRMARGRWVTDEEPAAACVINEQLAARDFPGEDPIGRRIRIGGPLDGIGPEVRFATIVGVVADLRAMPCRQERRFAPESPPWIASRRCLMPQPSKAS
jgi:putative ABC transport system permease protein